MIKNIITLTLIGFTASILLYFTNELISTKEFNEDDINVLDNNISSNFSILSSKEEDGVYKYQAKTLGYVDDITLEITISDDVVTNIEVIYENDSYFSLVTKADYINTLKENYNNLNNIDVVSGATYTSEALIEIVKGVLKEHKEAN